MSISYSSSSGGLSAADRAKLDGIEAGAAADQTAAEVRNLLEGLSDKLDTDALEQVADNLLITSAERTKLTGIATNATANSADATLLARANHTGTQSADTITDGATNHVFTAADDTKLGGIATSATANDTDANLKNRANHTGTQSADTITDGTANKVYTAAEQTKLGNVEASATADQTAAEIRDALQTLAGADRLDVDYTKDGTANYHYEANARAGNTGFVDSQRGNSAVYGGWDDGTKILTLTHSSDYEIWAGGTKVTITGNKTKDISGSIAEGWWHFWIDSSAVLQASQTFPGFDTSCLVAFLYWDATNTKALAVADERHGIKMDTRTHSQLHDQIGTRHKSGLAGTASAVSVPTAPSNDQSSKIWFSGGVISDEDYEITIVNDGTPAAAFEQILGSDLTSDAAKLPVWYLSGAGETWRAWDNDSDRYAFYHGGGNTLPSWNEYTGGAWQLTAATNKDFVVYFVCASNFLETPVFLKPHTAKFTTIEAAQAVGVGDIEWGSYPFPEVVVLYRLIFECRTAYTNATHRAVLRDVEDLRNTSVSAVAASPGFSDTVANAWYGATVESYSVQTTDATVTDLATIAVSEGEAVFVKAFVTAQETDESNRATYELQACFYRNTAGNVTLQGSVIANEVESDANWDADLVADTGNQTIDLDVTGVAATTVDWFARVEYSKVAV